VQDVLERKERGNGHARGAGDRHVTGNGQCSQRKNEHRSDDRGGSECAFGDRFSISEKKDRAAVDGEREGKSDQPLVAAANNQRAPNAAKHAAKRDGTQSCCPVAFRFIARFPAALEADNKADGERNAEALEEFECINDEYLNASFSGAKRQLSLQAGLRANERLKTKPPPEGGGHLR
jgi:hypothetical protein